MHIGSHYKINQFLNWTRINIIWLSIVAIIPTVLYALLDFKWLAIPWQPVALVGTAAAFIAGFKNTQTYNRLWEARKIWGAIINDSRTWGLMAKDFVVNLNGANENLSPIHKRSLGSRLYDFSCDSHNLGKIPINPILKDSEIFTAFQNGKQNWKML